MKRLQLRKCPYLLLPKAEAIVDLFDGHDPFIAEI